MTTQTEWAESPEHPGYRVKVIERGNCTIEILRPVLSGEEQMKREAHLKSVAERTLANYYKRKEKIS